MPSPCCTATYSPASCAISGSLPPGAAEDLAAETWLRVAGKLIRWSPIRTGKPPARPWTT
jgi:DNA-directed RNA polymerase specialized sigma24 family protein